LTSFIIDTKEYYSIIIGKNAEIDPLSSEESDPLPSEEIDPPKSLQIDPLSSEENDPHWKCLN
jgi:hypothetical protein